MISKVMALNMGFFMQLLFSCLHFCSTECMCADLITSFSLVTFCKSSGEVVPDLQQYQVLI